jgi:hypothetical protein
MPLSAFTYIVCPAHFGVQRLHIFCFFFQMRRYLPSKVYLVEPLTVKIRRGHPPFSFTEYGEASLAVEHLRWTSPSSISS